MNTSAIEPWLRKKKTSGFFQYESLGFVGFLAGMVIVFLTFWLTYGIIWFGWYGVSAVSELIFNKRLSDIPHGLRLTGSGIFIVLLFIQHIRTNPSHWGDYPRRDYTSSDELAKQAAVTFAVSSIGVLLLYPGASANMITDILLTGPRLLTGGCGLMKQGYRMKTLDENGCASLLSFLLSQPHAVHYDELKAAGWGPWFEQLHCIDGVEFLEKGLLLSEELREELNHLPKN